MVDKYFFWEADVPPIKWDEYKAEDEHDKAKYFASIAPHYGGFSSRAYEKCLEKARDSRVAILENFVRNRLRMQEYQGRKHARDRDWDAESWGCSSCGFSDLQCAME